MWPNPQEPAALATFTEEILNRKLHFLYSAAKHLRTLWKQWKDVNYFPKELHTPSQKFERVLNTPLFVAFVR